MLRHNEFGRTVFYSDCCSDKQICIKLYYFNCIREVVPVPVAVRSKAWVYGRWPAEIVGSNPAGGVDVCVL